MDSGKVKLAEQFDKFPWVGTYADCVALGQTDELAAIDVELRSWLLDMVSMGQAIMDADEQLAMVYQLVHRAHLRARVALEAVRAAVPVHIADAAYRSAVHVAELTLAYIYDFHACVKLGYVQDYLEDLRLALGDEDAESDSGESCESLVTPVACGVTEVAAVDMREECLVDDDTVVSLTLVDGSAGVSVATSELLVANESGELSSDEGYSSDSADEVKRNMEVFGSETGSDARALTDWIECLEDGVKHPVPSVAIVPVVASDDVPTYPFAVLDSVTVVGATVKLTAAQVELHQTGWGLRGSAEGLSDRARKLMHAVTMVEAVNSVMSGQVWIRSITEVVGDNPGPLYVNYMAGTYGVMRFEVRCHPSGLLDAQIDKPSSVVAGSSNVFTSFPAHLDGAFRDKCGARVYYVDPPYQQGGGWMGGSLEATHDVIRRIAGRQDFSGGLSPATAVMRGFPSFIDGYDDEDYADALVEWETSVHDPGDAAVSGGLACLMDTTLLNRQLSGDEWNTYNDVLHIIQVMQSSVGTAKMFKWVGAPGFCYLELIKSDYKRAAADQLGAWPVVGDLLALESHWFELDVVATQALMMQIRPGIFHVERVDLLPGVQTNGRFMTIWSDKDLQTIGSVCPRSFAGWLQRTRAAHVREGVLMPEPTVSIVPLDAHVGGQVVTGDAAFAVYTQSLIDSSSFFTFGIALQLAWAARRWICLLKDDPRSVGLVRAEIGCFIFLFVLQAYCWAIAVKWDVERM